MSFVYFGTCSIEQSLRLDIQKLVKSVIHLADAFVGLYKICESCVKDLRIKGSSALFPHRIAVILKPHENEDLVLRCSIPNLACMISIHCGLRGGSFSLRTKGNTYIG
jgi:hypothetical protein